MAEPYVYWCFLLYDDDFKPSMFVVCAVLPFRYDDGKVFNPAQLDTLPWDGVLLGMGLGFCLSLLFLMDQNISQSMVNSPDNKYGHNSVQVLNLPFVGCRL